MESARKPVAFLGNSLADLRAFPEEVRSEAGYQISRVQLGLEPTDWKAMATVGSGAYEIRVRDESGIFRVIYVTKKELAVYVLHCFQKKTRRTSAADVATAQRRYKEIPE